MPKEGEPIPVTAIRINFAERLRRYPTKGLPPLARDEDPADIFIDCFDRYPNKFANLRIACSIVADQWAYQDDEMIKKNPESLGELLYLCDGAQAQKAIPAIAHVASRAGLASTILPGGEDVQTRALRALAGLLVNEPPQVRERYRNLFEIALDDPTHAPIGLTTLTAFWPEDRDEFIRRALEHKTDQNGEIAWLVKNLDLVLQTFSQD